MKDQLTVAQRAVVEHRSGALLVSASAGSGKTRVLVERVLERISQGCNIDEFLIVTFTIAAAAELRRKLADEIAARLAADPQNEHLRAQLPRLGFAQISTVHSFCAEILRSYAHLCDLPPDFRVADEMLSEPLREFAAQSTVERAYRDYEQNPDFAALLDTLGYARDDRKLLELLLDAYDRIGAHADPTAWMDACRAELENIPQGVEHTLWGKALLEDFRAMLKLKMQQYDYAISLLHDEPALAGYLPCFIEDRDMFARLAALSWDELSTAQPTYNRLGSALGGADVFVRETVKKIRNDAKNDVKQWLAHFVGGSEAATADLQKTAAPLRGLFGLLRVFDETYTAEKRRRRLLDFGDLEHEAVKLLLRGDEPTAAAREIASRYTEIMVDEYQDSNAVQDAIYRAVSKNGENLFFVGDIKQSIYGFRLADPTIFAEKYRTYDERDNAGDTPRKILLTHNFRSSPSVLDAVNDVFSLLMTADFGGVDYTEKEQMQSGRADSFIDLGEPAVELHCIESDADDDDDDDALATDRMEVEARFIAQRIRELIDGEHFISNGMGGKRRITAGDIAVLLRSYASVAPAVLDALHDAGIPAVGRGDADLYTADPVKTLSSFLRAVHNPRISTALAAAMLSPAGGFTADELARLRTFASGDLCDALRACAKENEKAASFAALLDDLREKSKWMPLGDWIDETVRVTSLSEICAASADGEVDSAMLRSFCALCGTLIEHGTDDLGSLLYRLDVLREKEQRVPTEETQALGCVRVLTIHAAKGLEYPVVVLANLSGRFNKQDLSDPLLTDTALMASCNVIDTEKMASYPSAAKLAMKEKKQRELYSEELRLLYVAMTRPQERLIMTYCYKNIQNRLAKLSSFADSDILRYFATDAANGIGDWVLMAAASRPEAHALFPNVRKRAALGAPWKMELHDVPRKTASRKIASEAQKPIDETCLDRSYVYSDAPAKITATQLKGRSLDRESADGAGQVQPVRPEIRERPFSLAGRPLSSTERGTATHLFLQFCRYEACCTEAGVAEEKARLVREAFLTEEQADCVSESAVAAFFTSELGKRIFSAPFLRREFKFSLLTTLAPVGAIINRPPDEQNTPDVLLQGVVDCFWREDGGLCVLDFKTDAVSADGVQARAENYRPQIEAYASALERIYGEPVKEKILYFFRCGKAVTL